MKYLNYKKERKKGNNPRNFIIISHYLFAKFWDVIKQNEFNSK